MNLKTLQCHSRGDKRFSALFAGPITWGGVNALSIESLYQGSKLINGAAAHDLYSKPGWVAVTSGAKGKRAEMFLVGDIEIPIQLTRAFYHSLWFKYLDEHPNLVGIAMNYHRFADPFARKGGVSQADAIAEYVAAKKRGISPWSLIPDVLKCLMRKDGNAQSREKDCGVYTAGPAVQ